MSKLTPLFDMERALKGKRKAGRIENYRIVDVRRDADVQIASGDIYDDSRWPDGTYFTTSRIVAIHEAEHILETKYSYYTLGKKNEHSD